MIANQAALSASAVQVPHELHAEHIESAEMRNPREIHGMLSAWERILAIANW